MWDGVPSYPTNNPYIAEMYAELITSFLVDARATLDPNQPIYIVEMGAGVGCFGYYFLKSLASKRRYYKAIADLPVRYVMSDFAEKNIAFWEEHPMLQPFQEEGILDYAVFRPEEEQELELRESGTRLRIGQLSNPLIAISNYFFDSIRQELFRIEGDELKHALITLDQSGLADELDSPNLERISIEEDYVPVDWNYYRDPRLNAVLQSYRERFDEATILFPIAAFRCIENLLTLSANNLVLITTDKAFVSEDHIRGPLKHHCSVHGSAFSYCVNFDAITTYFDRLGATSYTGSDETHYLLTMMNALVPEASTFENCAFYFYEKVAKQNLPNNLYQLQDILENSQAEPLAKLRAAIAAIRLSDFDPIWFYNCADRICDAAKKTEDAQRAALVEVLEKVGANLYKPDRERNVLYWLGRIYFELEMVDECEVIFRGSIHFLGPDDDAYYYLGACAELRDDYSTAHDYYEKALELEGDSKITRAALRRVMQKLNK